MNFGTVNKAFIVSKGMLSGNVFGCNLVCAVVTTKCCCRADSREKSAPPTLIVRYVTKSQLLRFVSSFTATSGGRVWMWESYIVEGHIKGTILNVSG